MKTPFLRKPLSPAAVKALCAALGALSAMSFVMSGEGYVGLSDPPASATSYLWGALALCFGWLFWRVYGVLGLRASGGAAALGLCFGLVNAFGTYLFAYDSWAGLLSPAALGLTLLKALGQALPMTAAFEWLHRWALGAGEAKHHREAGDADGLVSSRESAAPKGLAALDRLYRARPVLTVTALLALCWSPYLIVYFPGTVCWDLGEMAAQFFGLREMTTWHSVFLTGVFGGLVWLGRLFDSDNLGAALYMLLQTLALAYALAKALDFAKRLGLSRGFLGGGLLFFALTPIFGGYAQFISKDTPYTAALCLFALAAGEVLLCRERGEAPGRGLLIRLCLWGVMASLCRNNGLYVVLPSALVLAAVGAKGRARLPLTAAVAALAVITLGFTHGLVPALNIKDATASGLYSVCFQQSARVLRDHRDEVTEAEYAEIDRVLDGAKLAALYEPNISDPVKYTFKYYGQGEAEKAALSRYMKTWRKMLNKFSLSYAEGFFSGNIGYYTFIPKLEGESYNDQAGNRLVFETYDVGEEPAYLHTRQWPALEGARRLLAVFARGWRHIPLLSLTYCCAAYTWLMAGAALSLARQRRWRRLAAFLPALLSLGVCLLSPVNDYFRYFLPIAAMTVPLLALTKNNSEWTK